MLEREIKSAVTDTEAKGKVNINTIYSNETGPIMRTYSFVLTRSYSPATISWTSSHVHLPNPRDNLLCKQGWGYR
jgi:hypothetical protein